MKKEKYLLHSCCFLVLCFAVTSCGEDEKNFDRSLMSGKWKQGTVFEFYKADGTGHTWDENDDVSEDEAQKFKWTLDKNELTVTHLMEIGTAEIPKLFTVTELTSTSLKYKNDYGKACSFTKVP